MEMEMETRMEMEMELPSLPETREEAGGSGGPASSSPPKKSKYGVQPDGSYRGVVIKLTAQEVKRLKAAYDSELKEVCGPDRSLTTELAAMDAEADFNPQYRKGKKRLDQGGPQLAQELDQVGQGGPGPERAGRRGG